MEIMFKIYCNNCGHYLIILNLREVLHYYYSCNGRCPYCGKFLYISVITDKKTNRYWKNAIKNAHRRKFILNLDHVYKLDHLCILQDVVDLLRECMTRGEKFEKCYEKICKIYPSLRKLELINARS